ncbi:MAG: RnfABCDGE type electron transport complex subunit D, partial [Christensenellales bacterium]
MIKRFIMTPAPHVLHRDSTRSIMRDVIIALVPAVIAGFIFFGWQAMGVLFMSTASCVVFEALYQRVCKKQVTVGDLSAVVTGLILGLNLPANSPAWMVVLGSAFAIVLVKQLFGGLGHNFCNPALAARIMLTVSFAVVIGQAVPTRFMQAEAEAAAAARASYGIVQTDTESGTMPDADSSATPDTDSSATPDTDSSATPDGASSATPDGASSATPDAESSATPDALSSATPLAMLKRNAGDEIP